MLFQINSQLEIDRLYKTSDSLKRGIVNWQPFLQTIEYETINMGEYDNSLMEYCEQVLDKNYKHHKTSWVQSYENLVCIGRLDVDEKLQVNAIKRRWQRIPPWDKHKSCGSILSICSVTERRWIVYKSIEREPSPHKIHGNVKFYIKEILKIFGICRKDRVLNVVKSLIVNGYNDKKFFIKGGKNKSPDIPVLGHLVKNDCYVALTGRHRIAALRYLAKIHHKQFKSTRVPVIQIDSDNFALSETMF